MSGKVYSNVSVVRGHHGGKWLGGRVMGESAIMQIMEQLTIERSFVSDIIHK